MVRSNLFRVTRSELADKIRQCKRFYSVVFKKRTDGQMRKMVCLNGVKKHLAGGRRAYNPTDHNLIGTFSVDIREYRSIPIEGVVAAKIDGNTFIVRN